MTASRQGWGDLTWCRPAGSQRRQLRGAWWPHPCTYAALHQPASRPPPTHPFLPDRARVPWRLEPGHPAMTMEGPNLASGSPQGPHRPLQTPRVPGMLRGQEGASSSQPWAASLPPCMVREPQGGPRPPALPSTWTLGDRSPLPPGASQRARQRTGACGLRGGPAERPGPAGTLRTTGPIVGPLLRAGPPWRARGPPQSSRT